MNFSIDILAKNIKPSIYEYTKALDSTICKSCKTYEERYLNKNIYDDNFDTKSEKCEEYEKYKNPLFYALRSRHSNCAEHLINDNINYIHDVNCKGYTPLHKVAKTGNEKLMNLMIKQKADINAVSQFRKLTPLHMAAKSGHTSCVNLLLNSRAHILIDSCGYTPLFYSIKEGHLECSKLLMRVEDIFRVNINKDSYLHIASASNNKEMVKLLISAGLDFNATNNYMSTPAHKAAHSGNINIVNLLCDAGININAKDKDNNTILIQSLYSTNTGFINKLLALGADINHQNYRGSTPLHWASMYRNPMMVDHLISLGAKTNIQDINGNTFLHLTSDKLERIKKLKIDSDLVRIRNKNGDTAISSLLYKRDEFKFVKRFILYDIIQKLNVIYDVRNTKSSYLFQFIENIFKYELLPYFKQNIIDEIFEFYNISKDKSNLLYNAVKKEINNF